MQLTKLLATFCYHFSQNFLFQKNQIIICFGSFRKVFHAEYKNFHACYSLLHAIQKPSSCYNLFIS